MGIITAFATRHPLLSFLLSALVCCLMAYHIPKVKTIEDVDRFVLMDDADNQFYQEFKRIFGNDEFFVVVFERDNIFTKETLQLIKELTEDLEKLELVREVESLSNIDINTGGEDFFETRRFLDTIPDGEDELRHLRNIAVNHPLYVNNFISTSGTTTAIVISAFDRPEDDFYRPKLLDAIEQVLGKYQGEDLTFHLAGKTVTDVTMSRYIDEDFAILVPASYLLIAAIIFIIYRSLLLTAIAVLNISACLLSTMGFLGLMDITQNSVISIVFPLVMALSLCDTVHIFSGFKDPTIKTLNRESLKKVLDKVVWPCFLTTATTAIGFLSLLTNRLEPIQNFAVVASCAMFFEFFFSFFLMPPLLLKLYATRNPVVRRDNSRLQTLLHGISCFSRRHPLPILWVSALTVIGALAAGSNIAIETNVVEFFKHQSAFRQDLDFVENRLGGIESLDISLKASQPEAFKDPTHLATLEQIQNFAKTLPGVDVTLSFVDYLKDMNQAFHRNESRYHILPQSKELIAQYLLLYDSDDIEDFINPLYDHARIVIRISEHNSEAQKDLIAKLREYIASLDNSTLDIRITGRVLQDVKVIDSLFTSQIQSLGLAFVTISILMFLVLRSLRLGLLSIPPNLFPIIANFGIMGALGIPLNTATSLIAAIAFGIAVDDTIHFLVAYKNSDNTQSVDARLHLVIMEKGQAIVTSSLILCAGFGVLALSNFIPTVHFGLLSATVMLTAMVGDLILLPAIVVRANQFKTFPSISKI